MNKETQKVTDALVGKSLPDARKFAADQGFRIRVMARDGESLLGTCDYRSNRINVETNEGCVTQILKMG